MASSSAAAARCNATRCRQLESSENDPTANLSDTIQMHIPLRSPLISIPEPSQNPKENPPSRGTGSTPRSTHSTPTKAVSRAGAGNTGSIAYTGSHHSQYGGTRARVSSSRVSRGLMDSNPQVPVQVPYFELDEDPSYWKDHNVQVLIRIRPINSTESSSHGYKRCLMQESSKSLLWTGNPESMFTFDHIACEAISQDKLFKVVGQPMVENCMLGYNSCLFAYGQTGSGKTYTMMGEIHDTNRGFSEDCGITPRIFDYLFMRIKEAEETRSDEMLKYSCKCSFLEIYNEQITDLLEPSSTNLQLREDIKKGVYVENLTEHEVSSVKDVIELLLQGAANRKMAATNMNSESSRSHSVFTCVIESRWEKDSMTHFRFGRLNLVDLAGSERQKSSGAEGDRLKEAANINRSLSTLGLVIMTLVDIASGRSRHVPYRDSRLTFLLQDSLGGNSKTTIIANVSQSICSASETLSTLKFAQRAKLIQNNAKVNEDASGDVMALQRQIQKLKDQLTFVIKHQNTQISRCSLISSPARDDLGDLAICESEGNSGVLSDSIAVNEKIKFLETALSGTRQRENTAEATIQRLEAEIVHLNYLVQEREDDALRTKAILKFREEKIRRLENLADDLLCPDGYLIEENKSLSEEIQLLKSRIDGELAKFVLEKMRLLEQLKMYQEFYHQGERYMPLPEVSHLCTQHLKTCESEYELSRNKVCKMAVSEQLEADHQMSQRHKTPAKLVCLGANYGDIAAPASITKLETSQTDNDAGRILNSQLQYAVSQLLCEDERAYFQDQAGTEAAKTVLTSIEGCSALQQEDGSTFLNQLSLRTQLLLTGNNEELNDMNSYLIQENVRLAGRLANKDAELTALSNEWEKAIIDLTNFLLDGCKSLEDAQDHIGIVVDLFPQKNLWINEHVVRAIKVVIEKETSIVNLQKGLEDAQQMGLELKSKLNSLRGATLAMTEFHQLENDENSKEFLDLTKLLREKNTKIHELEGTLEHMEKHILDAETTANSAFELLNELHDISFSRSVDAEALASRVNVFLHDRSQFRELNQVTDLDPVRIDVQNQVDPGHAKGKDAQILTPDGKLSFLFEENSSKAQRIGEEILGAPGDMRVVVDMAVRKVRESEIFLCTTYADIETYLTDLLSDIKSTSSAVRILFKDAIADVSECNSVLKGFKDQMANPFFRVDSLVSAEKQLNQTADLFLKFEAAQQTMEEAELMLNALLKANQDAKWERDWWKQNCNELLEEKALLTEKVNLLEASSYAKEEQYRNLQDQINASLVESLSLASSLVESFQEIQRTYDHELDLISSDIVSIRQDVLRRSEASRSWLDDMISDTIEQGLVQTVIYQCYLGAVIDLSVSLDSKTFHNRHEVPLRILNNGQMPCTNIMEDIVTENLQLNRKENLMEGLLFDIRLLQLSNIKVKGMIDETEEVAVLNKVTHEIEMKDAQIDDILCQQGGLKALLSACEMALSRSRSELEEAEKTISTLSNQKNELTLMLEAEHVNRIHTEELLEDKMNIIQCLEREVISSSTSTKGESLSSVEDVDKSKGICDKRDQLQADILRLNDMYDMASALADENEAIAVEARQVAETNKIYAKEKEEEVTVLERSVQELEDTIEVLAKKVCELKEEADRHRLIRKDLELEVKILTERMLRVESATGTLTVEDSDMEGDFQIPKKTNEQSQIQQHIEDLEMENAAKVAEIKQYKDYISEILLHSEAQSSIYQEKYKALEGMVSEVKTDPVTSSSVGDPAKITERVPVRARGSGSPFKCIASLVQQVNSEKDKELYVARQRIEELEALVARKQKEVCTLNARLAAVDSMTHDVIRDLLGVKLDMNTYANVMEQEQLQKLTEAAQQQAGETDAKDSEIMNLNSQIDQLVEERNSLIKEIHETKSSMLASQVKLERLRQRDQLLTAQMELLKKDKTNLHQKIAELDNMIKRLVGSQDNDVQIRHHLNIKQESSSLEVGRNELRRELAPSERLLSQRRNQLGLSRRSNSKTH